MLTEMPQTDDHLICYCSEVNREPSRAELLQELKRVQQDSEWMHMVIDTCNDAFVSTNVMGEVLQWNSKAVRLFGWSHDEIIGKRLTDTIFPAEVSGRGTGGLQHLVQIQKEGKRMETNARTKAGRQIPVEVSIAPMRKGSSFVLNAFMHDITARRQLQTQLNHANKLQSVGQLSAGIAHEINTPTQYVGDNTRFLQESLAELMEVLTAYESLTRAVELGQDVRPAIAHVHQAIKEADVEYLKTEIGLAIQQSLEGIERVAAIVRAMKEFSHPGSVEKIPTDINRAIQNTVTVATNEWKYVATVQLDLEERLPLVPCLPGDFNQVILNLVVNAAHAIGEAIGRDAPEKGKITVSTRKVPGYAEIRVSDTGTGIPDEIRDRIFDPFFTTKDVGVGSGQGLAIARSVIVDKHEGQIRVETEVGLGTTFIIQLPL